MRRIQQPVFLTVLVAVVPLAQAFAPGTVPAFWNMKCKFADPLYASSNAKQTRDSDKSSIVTSTATDASQIEHGHCQQVGDRDILIRAASGKVTERTPVWLMRQAGRYMAAFRAYSTKYGFRQRSETPEIAVELSLQCHRKYGMDGIIMFSDILTPLPSLGIEFDVQSGVGPVISTKIASQEDVKQLVANPESIDFDDKLPFIRPILNTLSQEAELANTSLIGFVGAPFTLAAYILEDHATISSCPMTKQYMIQDEAGTDKTISLLLEKLAILVGRYACHQIECGAQVIQIFESWAHQLSPARFVQFAKPAAQKAIQIIKENYPNVPIIYYANGGSSFLEYQRPSPEADWCPDMIGVDWQVDMEQARKILGPNVPISGNVDPTILRYGTKEQIEAAVRECIDKAGGPGNKHILNLGHGVMQGTPEEAVGWFVDEAKRYHRAE